MGPPTGTRLILGNFVTVSERVSAPIDRTRYPLMLPFPFGEGTVSCVALIRSSVR